MLLRDDRSRDSRNFDFGGLGRFNDRFGYFNGFWFRNCYGGGFRGSWLDWGFDFGCGLDRLYWGWFWRRFNGFGKLFDAGRFAVIDWLLDSWLEIFLGLGFTCRLFGRGVRQGRRVARDIIAGEKYKDTIDKTKAFSNFF